MSDEATVGVVFTALFRWSPNGCDVIEYEAGPEAVAVSEQCADVAVAAGYAVLAAAGAEPAQAAKPAAKPARKRSR